MNVSEALAKLKEDGSNWAEIGEFLGKDNIEQLGLSVRPLYCLRKAGITDINQVAKLSFDELMEIRNMGRKGSEEVLKKVQAFLAERATVSEMERVGKE